MEIPVQEKEDALWESSAEKDVRRLSRREALAIGVTGGVGLAAMLGGVAAGLHAPWGRVSRAVQACATGNIGNRLDRIHG